MNSDQFIKINMIQKDQNKICSTVLINLFFISKWQILVSGVEVYWSRPFLSGAGAGARADPIESEPESALGPWASGAGAGAAQKSGSSGTLDYKQNEKTLRPQKKVY